MEGLDQVEIGRSALAQMVGDGLQYLAVRGSERECRNSTGIDLERMNEIVAFGQTHCAWWSCSQNHSLEL